MRRCYGIFREPLESFRMAAARTSTGILLVQDHFVS